MSAQDQSTDATGTDLSSTREKLAAQSANIQNLSEISRNSRTTFITILLACAYSYLTVATTKDAALLSNSVASPLPIIQAHVQLVWFYYFAPLLLLLMFLYFHLYLQRFWRCVAVLPPFHSDGRSLDDYVYPWLISSAFLRAEIPQLQRERSRFRFPLESGISIFLGWWFVPIILGVFWARYLVLHDWWGTLWHIGLMALGGGAAVRFYYSARFALAKGTGSTLGPLVRFNRILAATVALAIVGIFAFISHGAISGAPVSRCATSEYTAECSWKYSGVRLLWLFGYAPYLDVANKKIAEKPDDWAGLIADNRDVRERLKEIPAPSLATRDLRFMNAAGAFLANTDFDGGQPDDGTESDGSPVVAGGPGAFDIYGAMLTQAVLSGARLNGAILNRADLANAQLQWSELNHAKLDRAVLSDADLSNAELAQASLRDATLFYARLVNISGREVDFTRAEMSGANLSGAELHKAIFTTARLQQANMSNAVLDQGDFKGADLSYALLEGATLSGATFEGTILTGANFFDEQALDNPTSLDNATFRGAELMGATMNNITAPGAIFIDTNLNQTLMRDADLRNARFSSESELSSSRSRLDFVDFSGANLSEAVFEKSILTNAIFQGAILEDTKLIRCDLSGAQFDSDAGLEQAHFQGSCGDELTRLPKNIRLPACHQTD